MPIIPGNPKIETIKIVNIFIEIVVLIGKTITLKHK